jgi:CheY-like chemotaxis protein
VSKPTDGATALIVDDDLGFVCWLSERLNEAGYQCVPALNAHQAGHIVNEMNLKISVVLANPQLRGIRKLTKTLNNSDGPSLKIILIRDATMPTFSPLWAHAVLERPSGQEPASRHQWLRKLRMTLRQAEGMTPVRRISAQPLR